MKSYCRIPLLVALAFIAVACVQKQSASKPAVQYLTDILSDPECSEYKSIAAFERISTKGDIVIVDSPERAVRFSDAFVNCDFCDNISGAEGSDLLPDFAGESISAVLDVANGDYSSLYSETADTALRTLTVRAFFAALDTACCIAPYDNDFSSVRRKSKCTVLSSPYMDVCGKFDIDTLIKSTGADFPVIYPVRASFERAYELLNSNFNIAVIPEKSISDLRVYSDIFKDVAGSHSDRLSSCVALRADNGGDLFLNTVELYAAAGMDGRLRAVVIDDPSVDPAELKKSYERILSVQNEKNLELRKHLSPDIVFLTSLDCAARSCYRLFRERNIFTHRIAYPQASAYITKDLPGRYVLMDYHPTYLPQGLEEKLRDSAPKSIGLYVQN